MEDNVVYGAWDSVNPGHQEAGQLGSGGSGPHDPFMDARVNALEAQARETQATLQSMQTTMARIEATLAGLATKADLATVSANVAGLDRRLALVEGRLDGVVTQAVGKTIGGWQLVGIIASLMAVATGFYTALRYLFSLPFMH